MGALTSLDLLYFVLAFFVTILGTLLSIILFRVMKILGVVQEVAMYYYKVKQILGYYSHIPDMLKEKIIEIIHSKKTDESEKNKE